MTASANETGRRMGAQNQNRMCARGTSLLPEPAKPAESTVGTDPRRVRAGLLHICRSSRAPGPSPPAIKSGNHEPHSPVMNDGRTAQAARRRAISSTATPAVHAPAVKLFRPGTSRGHSTKPVPSTASGPGPRLGNCSDASIPPATEPQPTPAWGRQILRLWLPRPGEAAHLRLSSSLDLRSSNS